MEFRFRQNSKVNIIISAFVAACAWS